jgi:hypothetical protein
MRKRMLGQNVGPDDIICTSALVCQFRKMEHVYFFKKLPLTWHGFPEVAGLDKDVQDMNYDSI